MKKDDISGVVRKRIEIAIEAADQERRRKSLIVRLELVRTGIAAYQNGNIPDAVRCYHHYLKLLEEAKNVNEGGLMPSHFNVKTDLPELMTVSGIYWDLVKIYDHLKPIERSKNFLHYIEKYIIFSKGFSYQPLCAESLRKYIRNRNPVHKKDFKYAYQVLNVSKCFVVSSLVDVCSPDTLIILRNFRDTVLMKNRWSKRVVFFYYRQGPRFARQVDQLPQLLRQALAIVLDMLAQFIRLLVN